MNRRQISNTALLLLAAGLLAAGMSSCRKDIDFYREDDAVGETWDQDGPQIEFSAYTPSVPTKGLSYSPEYILGHWDTTSTAYVPGTGVGVFAFYQKAKSNGYPVNFTSKTGTPTFMYNQKVERTSTDGTSYKFIYSPHKYWPNNTNDQLSFFAYAPYDETAAWEDLGFYSDLNGTYIRRDYEIEHNVEDQRDFMWADPVMNRKKTDGTQIDFAFKHLCARISVTAVANYNPYTPYLTVDTLSFRSKFYTSGTWEYKLATKTGGWRNLSRSSHELTYYPFREEYSYNPTLGRDTSNAVRVTNVEKLAHPENCYMFVLPGTQDIKFHYAMSQRNPTTGDVFAYWADTLFTNMQLEAGKAYNFKLDVTIEPISISGVSVTSIDLIPEIQNIP